MPVQTILWSLLRLVSISYNGKVMFDYDIVQSESDYIGFKLEQLYVHSFMCYNSHCSTNISLLH